MIKALRYTIDRVADHEWQIFDEQKRGTPTTYFLYTSSVVGYLNTQLILTSYDAAAAASLEYPIFDTELYSTTFYVADEDQLENMVSDVIYGLYDTDIDNPVELAHLFGGQVRSENMRVPSIKDTN